VRFCFNAAQIKRENVHAPSTGNIAVRLGTAADREEWQHTATAKYEAGGAASYKEGYRSDAARNKTRDAVARVALISFRCASATATA
jgi:hypothetical protein